MSKAYKTSHEKFRTSSTLFIGPLSGNYTGQRVSFEEVSNGNYRIDLLSKVNIIRIFYIFSAFEQVYYTGSRSQLGFVRDLLFIWGFLVTKRRVINHIHGDDFEKLILNGGVISRIALSLCKRIEVIVASADQARRLKSFFREVYVVNNFSRFRSVELRVSKEGNRMFLFISTISKEKGIFDWLEISYNLFKINSAYHFYIIGENVLKSEDLRLFFLKINNFVNEGMMILVVGKLNFEELRHYLNLGTDLIFTSKHPTENRPLVLLEAASMGLAIHCTAHRDLDKIYGLKLNSFHIDNNYFEIAYSIKSYLYSSQDIEFNRNLIRKNFSIEAHRVNVSEILM
jgi:glycosyltransferase involved in cell wall biosynthesis